ncbi:glycerol acyltransferase [bacterium M21]|nr:glycerol acyltransferase [bacterium M21]
MSPTNNKYPVAFAFLVEFPLADKMDIDVEFQEVSGLKVKLDTEKWTEGGENRFVHNLPNRPTYDPLVLKRAVVTSSPLITWVTKAVEEFEFKPLDVIVKLLNEEHQPLISWTFVNTWPTSWEVSTFNAEEGKLAIETLNMQYDYFRRIG